MRFASLARSLSEEIVNDEPFPYHFAVMIHYFYNTLCIVCLSRLFIRAGRITACDSYALTFFSPCLF